MSSGEDPVANPTTAVGLRRMAAATLRAANDPTSTRVGKMMISTVHSDLAAMRTVWRRAGQPR